MRLPEILQPHGLVQRVAYFLIKRQAGAVPGPIAIQSYRRSFFGVDFAKLLEQALRGPSTWSIGERELFAAFVAKQNECAY